MDIKEYIQKIGVDAKEASLNVAKAKTIQKNAFLELLATTIIDRSEGIIEANNKDVKLATESHLDAAFINRLTLDRAGIISMARQTKSFANSARNS